MNWKTVTAYCGKCFQMTTHRAGSFCQKCEQNFLRIAIVKAKEEARKEEWNRVKKNIPSLRQWLNEKPTDLLLSNEVLETWLDLPKESEEPL